MITLSGQLEGMSSRADRSWKLIFGTMELTPEEIGRLGKAQQEICYLAINPDPFTSEQKEAIENTKAELADTGKSPSERLRGVLFVNWKNNPEGYEQFHDYYISRYEKLFNHFKSKLP